MYVNEVVDISNARRQGWVTEVKREDNGKEKVRVQVVRQAGDTLEGEASYVTEFEPSTNWCKALVDG